MIAFDLFMQNVQKDAKNVEFYRDYAQALREVAAQVSTLADQVSQARADLRRVWQGEAADAATRDFDDQLRDITELATHLRTSEPAAKIDALCDLLLKLDPLLQQKWHDEAFTVPLVGWQIGGGLSPAQMQEWATPLFDELQQAYENAAVAMGPLASFARNPFLGPVPHWDPGPF